MRSLAVSVFIWPKEPLAVEVDQAATQTSVSHEMSRRCLTIVRLSRKAVTNTSPALHPLSKTLGFGTDTMMARSDLFMA